MDSRKLVVGRVWSPDSVVTQVAGLAWPVVVEQLLGTAVGLVNMYVAGQLGTDAIAAVGLSNQLRMLLMALFSAVGVGATALIARYTGAKELEETNLIGGQTIGLSLAVGAVAAIPCLFFGGMLMDAMGAAVAVVDLGKPYLTSMGTTMPLMALLFIGNAALRGAGDTRTPMIVMTLVNVINGLLTWGLVYGLGPVPALGFVGAGIAAAAGFGVGGLAVASVLLRGYSSSGLHVTVRHLCLRRDRVKLILRIGLPSAAEQATLRVGQLVLVGIVTQLGTTAYAGHQLAIQLLSVGFMPGFAFSVAATTLVGQELGRESPKRAAACVSRSMWMALTVMSLAGVGVLAFARPLLRIFTSDPDVVAQGYYALQGCAAMQVPLAVYFVFAGALRGAGDTRFVLLAQAIPIWLIRLTMAPLLGIAWGFGLTGIWAAMVLDVIGRAVMVVLRFRGGKWKHLWE